MPKTMKALLFIGLMMVPTVALAAEFRTGDQPSVAKGEELFEDVYLAGGSVRSAGRVVGDLIAGGGTVIVNGPVSADLAAGGGNVTVLADIGDDARVSGGNVAIEGAVGGDLIAGGGQVSLGGAGVRGEVIVGGGTIRIEAPVHGEMRLAGGQIYINAPITGDVHVYGAERVTLGSEAVLNGNLEYRAQNEVVLEKGAVVNGKVEYTPLASEETQRIAGQIGFGLVAAFIIGKFFALTLCALLVGLFFRRYALEAARAAYKNPLLELGRGFAIIFLLPAASVVLLITAIGAPFGLLGLLAFLASLLWAWLLAPIVIGPIAHQWWTGRADPEISIRTIILGTVIYTAVGFIPVLGSILQVAALFAAFGAAMQVKWQATKHWR